MSGRRYVNLDIAFHRHPKTRRLVGRLGRGAETILTRLLCHCGEHHFETGVLTGYTESEIETIVEWWGKPGACFEALVQVGWLEPVEGGYKVHDWLDHSGHLEFLSRRGRENAKKRWGKEDAISIPDSSADRNAPPSIPPSTHSPPLQKEDATKRRRAPPFQKPTVDEVRVYCLERKNTIDAEHFVNYYEARGWIAKGTPIKSWQACVITWEKNEKKREQNGGGTTKSSGHMGPGRVPVTREALDQNARRRANQPGSEDDGGQAPPSEPGPGAGQDPHAHEKSNP